MSVASFLKKVGLDALKAVQIGTEVIPVLQPFSALIPKIGSKVAAVEGQIVTKLGDFQQFFTDIQQVEAVTTVVTNGAAGTGASKAKVVAASLPTLMHDVELLDGSLLGDRFKNLSDADKQAFNAKLGEMAGNGADLLNILKV